MNESRRLQLIVGAAFLLLATGAVGQTFTTLVNLNRHTGGAPWYMSPVQGIDGSIYGTAQWGGGGGCVPQGCGTLLQLEKGMAFRSLTLSPETGSNPTGGLITGPGNELYGTSPVGGGKNSGTIFAVGKGGRVRTLYNFCSEPSCADGALPTSTLAWGVDGSLYGTTVLGGTNYCANFGGGCGTVFKLTPTGKLIVLHSFCSQPNCTDSSQPLAGLVQGSDGNFYGTTYGGGNGSYIGTVFKISPQGAFNTLYTFPGNEGPGGWLVQGIDGNFYGTSLESVFRITPVGDLTTLYTFCSQPHCADGDGLYAGLSQGSDGNFYGTTVGGGSHAEGTVFKISPEGLMVTLHSFDFFDGYEPVGGVTQATTGEFYGSTAFGGDLNCTKDGHGCGTLFSLDLGLGPFVAFIRGGGRVGQAAGILGQGFTGASSVSFSGTPAAFTVVSDTYLRATVPTGASTGYVTVTTPDGVLTSNVPFQIVR